jgi:hypothetical protein
VPHVGVYPIVTPPNMRCANLGSRMFAKTLEGKGEGLPYLPPWLMEFSIKSTWSNCTTRLQHAGLPLIISVLSLPGSLQSCGRKAVPFCWFFPRMHCRRCRSHHWLLCSQSPNTVFFQTEGRDMSMVVLVGTATGSSLDNTHCSMFSPWSPTVVCQDQRLFPE